MLVSISTYSKFCRWAIADVLVEDFDFQLWSWQSAYRRHITLHGGYYNSAPYRYRKEFGYIQPDDTFEQTSGFRRELNSLLSYRNRTSEQHKLVQRLDEETFETVKALVHSGDRILMVDSDFVLHPILVHEYRGWNIAATDIGWVREFGNKSLYSSFLELEENTDENVARIREEFSRIRRG